MRKGIARVNVKDPFDSFCANLMTGDDSCEALTREYLSVISSRNSLNAYLTVFEQEALEQARSVDKKIKEWKCRGCLLEWLLR